MTNDKYTVRDFLNSVLAYEAVSDIDKSMAKAMLAKLDERNEKRKNTPTKAQKENEPVKDSIRAYIADHSPAVASEIASACGVSTQKASALCRQLVDTAVLTVTDVKVKGKGTVKAYSLAESAD